MNGAATSAPTVFRIGTDIDLHLAVIGTRRHPLLTSFDPADRVLLSTVVSELGSNILKFAGSGEVRLRTLHEPHRDGLEIVAEDHGPGIDDVARALEDHFSSAGTLGLGLPSVRRIMSELQIDSSPGQGTRITARKWQVNRLGRHVPLPPAIDSDQAPPPLSSAGDGVRSMPLTIDTSVAVRPCYPERLSGDQIVLSTDAHRLLAALVDASGHGPEANATARALVAEIERDPQLPLDTMLKRLHALAHGTRGASVGLLRIDSGARSLQYAGVGNVRLLVRGAHAHSGVARDGVIGQRMPSPMLQTFSLSEGDLVVLFSDGVSESSLLHTWPEYLHDHGPDVADRLVRQLGRFSDDASCVVLRCRTKS